MSVSIKGRLKPGDYHLVVDRSARRLSVFKHNGEKQWGCDARAEGQHSDWASRNGDTPPGTYLCGTIYDTRGEAAYGAYCIDLVDLTGNEDDNGRAGISLHGGGSALPDPFAPHQGWANTHGCVRVQNTDLERIVQLIKTCKAMQRRVYLTVTE